MKNILFASLLAVICISQSVAQIMPVNREPHGGNRRAFVAEQLGVVKIEISYNRPGVKGREGKIYGTPVAHYGFVDLGHGTTNAAPWRAGANENTTMSFSCPVKIEGKDLPAGKYGFFIALGETENTLIFSKVNNSWGSFYYDESQDALRVTVKSIALDKSEEWLKYEFLDQADNSVTIAMSWEKRMIAFKVEADTKKLQIEAFRSDFRTTRPYYDFLTAVYWCLENDYELEQALAWADRAAFFRVMGEQNFRTLATKSMVLARLNRTAEARKLMQDALPYGSMIEVHSYGKDLIAQKDPKEAMKVFKMNYDKHPNEYATNVGMGRAYSANGDFKKALTYMKAGLAKAPDDASKANVQSMITKLENNTDVN